MLSSSCKYGIRAVTYIASRSKKNERIGIKQISEDLNLPTPFLAKILQLLAKQKILSSTKGPHGGFSLLKNPADISIMDIIVTIDGRDLFDNCLLHNSTCKCVEENKMVCPLHAQYSGIRTRLIKLFSNSNIANLVKELKKDSEIVI